jgi:hypothetical protein
MWVDADIEVGAIEVIDAARASNVVLSYPA